ncbi:MAG: hypothetical protein KGH69_01250 [Candidatus Micrarchaeota archaeon]|nr:hypothetical protein [Candidatus Micrarchaeota archaeon]
MTILSLIVTAFANGINLVVDLARALAVMASAFATLLYSEKLIKREKLLPQRYFPVAETGKARSPSVHVDFTKV